MGSCPDLLAGAEFDRRGPVFSPLITGGVDVLIRR